MTDRAAPYVLAAGESRRDDAILPFKAVAGDTGGLLSACAFTLGPWESGPVLHRHTEVDEAFYVVAGKLEAQLDDRRVQAGVGGFLWVPRGTAHSFANAGPEPVQVLALPGGVEELFAEQAAYLSSVQGPPDPSVLEEIGVRDGAPTVGPPIRSVDAPGHGPAAMPSSPPEAWPSPRRGTQPALGDGDDQDDEPKAVAQPDQRGDGRTRRSMLCVPLRRVRAGEPRVRSLSATSGGALRAAAARPSSAAEPGRRARPRRKACQPHASPANGRTPPEHVRRTGRAGALGWSPWRHRSEGGQHAGRPGAVTPRS